MSEFEPITFKARLGKERNLIADTEMRVWFIVDEESVIDATRLFMCMEQLLTVTVSDGLYLKDRPIRFRAKIPTGKSFTGGRSAFKATFDVPFTDIPESVRFYPLRALDCTFDVKVEKGDTLGTPLPVPKQREAKPPKVKGPYGAYWGYLFGKINFQFFPSIKRLMAEVSPIQPEAGKDLDVRAALHAIFQVESCSQIAPRQFRAWLQEHGWTDWALQRRLDEAEDATGVNELVEI